DLALPAPQLDRHHLDSRHRRDPGARDRAALTSRAEGDDSMRHRSTFLALAAGLAAAALAAPPARAASYDLLNVSYHPTRELDRAINAAFSQQYKAKTGNDVTIRQSHRGARTP